MVLFHWVGTWHMMHVTKIQDGQVGAGLSSNLYCKKQYMVELAMNAYV